jgi:predicted membrane protein
VNLATILERYGDGTVLAVGGAIIGALFGFFAQRSRFCLRAAVIEFWHRTFG